MRAHTAHKAEGESRIAAWAQLFYDNGVDVVVESDTHMVKRSYPVRPFEGEGSYESFIRDDEKGFVFIGEGSWGAPIRPTDDDKPWTMASDSFHQFKWIHVYPEEMLIRSIKCEDTDSVVPLTEENLFEEPENAIFWEPETGKILRLPFDPEHATYREPAEPTMLLKPGEVWSWSLDGTQWIAAKGPLGYGDSQVRSSIATGDAKPLSALFRRSFMVDDPASIARLFFDVLVDDGCVIKLNGKEVIRYNMPKGPITGHARATKRAVSWREKEALPLPVATAHLRPGRNTIEARVHQVAPDSSDLVFDLGVRIKRYLPVESESQ